MRKSTNWIGLTQRAASKRGQRAILCLAALGVLSFTVTTARAGEEVLIPINGSWKYLLYTNGANQPRDPATVDPDFHSTWHTQASYNGPAFTAASPALLGYGGINAGIESDIWRGRGGAVRPPANQRWASYFVTEFTPQNDIAELKLRGVIDDGCVIYINGTEIHRINMQTGTDTWQLRAASVGNENAPVTVNLTSLAVPIPAGVPAEIAVSLHNNQPNSSDQGFSLEVIGVGGEPAPHDDFVDANLDHLVGDLPLVGTNRTHNTGAGIGASKEPGEPNHGLDAGGASVWWAWTPSTNMTVTIHTLESDYDTLLGIYTGQTVNALTTIATDNDTLITNTERIRLDVLGGVTYYIAVDGKRSGNPATPAVGNVVLRISLLEEAEGEILHAYGDSWEYLLYTDAGDNVQNPRTVDSDFHKNWHSPDIYDGPPFFMASPSMLGYGDIPGEDNVGIVHDIWRGRKGTSAPPSGQRYTAYFRTTVIPKARVETIQFDGIVDDGCIFYVNGEEVGRHNVSGTAYDDRFTDRDHFTKRSSGNGSETVPMSMQFDLTDCPLVAGAPAVIAVSVHNASTSSSDLGMNLQISSIFCTSTEVPTNDDFANANRELASSGLPAKIFAFNSGNCHAPGASKEEGEPDHAGNPGGASVWFQMNPQTSGIHTIDTYGSSFDTIIAVYLGDSLDTLVEIASADENTVYGTERVQFNAIEGNVYYIAVDGHKEPDGGADFGDIVLNVRLSDVEVAEVLIPEGDFWEFLLYDQNDRPVSPEGVNASFDSTWMLPLVYNGTPSFSAFTNNMHGWGDFYSAGVEQIVGDLWYARDGAPRPPLTTRRTSYIRTYFEPTTFVSKMRISGIFDDGAVFYLDGVEIAKYNMVDGQDDWLLPAYKRNAAAYTVEFDVNPPIAPPGVYDFGVSIHNYDEDSCDLGAKITVEAVIPASVQAPPNDDFVNADNTQLAGEQPFLGIGRTHNLQEQLGASKEFSEPFHASNEGGGSIWWNWTPQETMRMELNTDGSNFETLIAVYTGSSLESLTPVASASSASFYEGARLVMNAVSGTVYRIAVDGMKHGSEPVAFGDVVLNIKAAPQMYDPTGTLLPAGAEWDFLLAVNASNQPIDPGSLDADFYTTWHSPGSYDGPAFQPNFGGLYGYGTINAGVIKTDVWGMRDHSGDGNGDLLPPLPWRNAVFFRTEFTPTSVAENLAFEGLVDDGAVIYINGTEVARMNVDPYTPVTNWLVRAKGQVVNGISTENAPQVAAVFGLDLPSGVPVDVGVMVVNDDPLSNDLGFDMRILEVDAVPVEFTADIVDLENLLYRISWESVPGGLYDVEFSEDLQTWEVISANITGRNGGVETVIVNPTSDGGSFRVHRKR